MSPFFLLLLTPSLCFTIQTSEINTKGSDTCKIQLHILFLLSSVNVCAYGNVTSDTGMACSGDSGGPMVVRENERSELLFNSDYSNNCV